MIYWSDYREDIVSILIAMSRLSAKCDILVVASTYRQAKLLAEGFGGDYDIVYGVDRITMRCNDNTFTFIYLGDGSCICGIRKPMLLWTAGMSSDAVEAIVAGRMAIANDAIEASRRDAIRKLCGGGI